MKAASIPETVVVGPFVYGVRADRVAIAQASRREKSDLAGHQDEQTLTITVDPEMATGMLRDTLLHEVLHAVMALTGLAFESGDEDDEKIVRRLSPALLDLMRRNPDLVAFLVADDAGDARP